MLGDIAFMALDFDVEHQIGMSGTATDFYTGLDKALARRVEQLRGFIATNTGEREVAGLIDGEDTSGVLLAIACTAIESLMSKPELWQGIRGASAQDLELVAYLMADCLARRDWRGIVGLLDQTLARAADSPRAIDLLVPGASHAGIESGRGARENLLELGQELCGAPEWAPAWPSLPLSEHMRDLALAPIDLSERSLPSTSSLRRQELTRWVVAAGRGSYTYGLLSWPRPWSTFAVTLLAVCAPPETTSLVAPYDNGMVTTVIETLAEHDVTAAADIAAILVQHLVQDRTVLYDACGLDTSQARQLEQAFMSQSDVLMPEFDRDSHREVAALWRGGMSPSNVVAWSESYRRATSHLGNKRPQLFSGLLVEYEAEGYTPSSPPPWNQAGFIVDWARISQRYGIDISQDGFEFVHDLTALGIALGEALAWQAAKLTSHGEDICRLKRRGLTPAAYKRWVTGDKQLDAREIASLAQAGVKPTGWVDWAHLGVTSTDLLGELHRLGFVDAAELAEVGDGYTSITGQVFNPTWLVEDGVPLDEARRRIARRESPVAGMNTPES